MEAILIYGQEGSGKSTYLYNMAKQDAQNGVKNIVIVPDQYTHQTELDIIAAYGKCGLTNTEVFSFKRLSHRLKLLYGGASVITLSEDGKTLLVNSLINRLRGEEDVALLKNAIATQVSGDIARLISRLKQYGVTPEDIENCSIDGERFSHTRAKLLEVAKVYRAYLQVSQDLVGRAFTDSEDDMALLCQNIAKSDDLVNTNVYIDGFDDFIKPELEVIKALIQRCNRVTLTLPCELNVRGNRGLLFYRQRKMIKAVEDAVALCGITPTRVNIAEPARFGKGEDIFVPKTERKAKDIAYIEENIFSAPRECTVKVENVVLAEDESPRAEAEHTADEIVRLVRDCGYRYNDIAVVCGDMNIYSGYVTRAFKNRGIPCFMDVKRDIKDNAVVRFILGLLDVVLYGRNTSSMCSLLRTGLLTNGMGKDEGLPLTFEDAMYLEKYATAYFIRGKAWSDEFKYGSDYYDVDRLNAARQRLMYYVEPFEAAMDSAVTAGDAAKAIEGYLAEKQLSDIIDKKILYLIDENRNDTASEYQSIWTALGELLVQVRTFMGDAPVTLEEFSELLRECVAGISVNVIPVCLDQVTVLEAGRTMAKHIKALFVIGAQCISQSDESGVFNRTELELLKANDIDIGADVNNSVGDVQYYIYKTLSKPTDRLWVTSSVGADTDESVSDPMLTNALKTLFGASVKNCKRPPMPYYPVEADNKAALESALLYAKTVTGIEPCDRYQLEKLEGWLGRNSEGRFALLSDIVSRSVEDADIDDELTTQSEYILKMKDSEYVMDISRLEKYVRCPYAYFVRYCLQPAMEGKGRVSAIDVGNIVHDMLDGFVKDVLDKGDGDESTVEAYIAENFDKKTEDYESRRIAATEENRYVFKRIRLFLQKMMTTMLEQRRNGTVKVYGTELEFDDKKIYRGALPSVKCTDSEGTSFSITGKIDSIEYCDTSEGRYWIINDYKTGVKPTDKDICSARSLQLPVYMLAVTEANKDTLPGAMFYVNVNDDLLRPEKGVEDIARDEKRYGKTGVASDSMELARAIDSLCLTKDGEGYDLALSQTISEKKNLSLLTNEDMAEIVSRARDEATAIFCDIKKGSIDKTPKRSQECSFCEYRRFCGKTKKYGQFYDETEDE